MIKIAKKGLILAGRHKGWQVVVQDDSANTGGYLILLTDKHESYDDWVENLEALESYFSESGWAIEWDDETR